MKRRLWSLIHESKEIIETIIFCIGSIILIVIMGFLFVGFLNTCSSPGMILEPTIHMSRIIDASPSQEHMVQRVLDNSPWFINFEITRIKFVSQETLMNVCKTRDSISGCAVIFHSLPFTNLRYPSSIYLLNSEYLYSEYTMYHEVGHILYGESETLAEGYASKCVSSNCQNVAGIIKDHPMQDVGGVLFAIVFVIVWIMLKELWK